MTDALLIDAVFNTAQCFGSRRAVIRVSYPELAGTELEPALLVQS